MLDVAKAAKELQAKSMADIERATAITWGSRAAASYQLVHDVDDLPARLRHFYEGENYRQEAFEHAAMAEDRGVLLRDIQDEVESYRAPALALLDPALQAHDQAAKGSSRGGKRPTRGTSRTTEPRATN